MRTVPISLKLSDAAFCLIGLIMLPVWQPGPSNSRAVADRACGWRDRRCGPAYRRAKPGDRHPAKHHAEVTVDHAKRVFSRALKKLETAQGHNPTLRAMIV